MRARSIARLLPKPVWDQGGWRVDTASASELRRYIFPEPAPGLQALGETIEAPRVFLKLCGDPDQLRALLPERWQIQPVNHMMICDRSPDPPATPPEPYRMVLARHGGVVSARILTAAGALAASGYAAETHGVLAYDRIVTDAAHRRRGLGRIVMQALASARQSHLSRQLLVATDEGRALYASLGWTDYSLYSTAFIPS